MPESGCGRLEEAVIQPTTPTVSVCWRLKSSRGHGTFSAETPKVPGKHGLSVALSQGVVVLGRQTFLLTLGELGREGEGNCFAITFFSWKATSVL